MPNVHDIAEILVELGKYSVEQNKQHISREADNRIKAILSQNFLQDYQKNFLICEILNNEKAALQLENRRKALLYVAKFLNDLAKNK